MDYRGGALVMEIGMRSRSYNNWLLIAVTFGISLSLISGTAVAQSQSGITSYIERDGRRVYTNFSISAPPAISVPPAVETARSRPNTMVQGGPTRTVNSRSVVTISNLGMTQ